MIFYIEKNTPELRQKLESMGFTKNPFISQENYIDENMFLVVCSDLGYNTIIPAYPSSKIVLPEYSIGCGKDEDMFFKKINKFINFIK